MVSGKCSSRDTKKTDCIVYWGDGRRWTTKQVAHSGVWVYFSRWKQAALSWRTVWATPHTGCVRCPVQRGAAAAWERPACQLSNTRGTERKSRGRAHSGARRDTKSARLVNPSLSRGRWLLFTVLAHVNVPTSCTRFHPRGNWWIILPTTTIWKDAWLVCLPLWVKKEPRRVVGPVGRQELEQRRASPTTLH